MFMKIKLLSDWFLKSLNGAADIAAEISDFKTRGKIKCKAPAFAHQYIKNFVGTSLWQTVFTLESLPESGEAALLCFDSADFYAEVYLNGEYLGSHAGREDPFYFNAAPYIKKTNRLAVKISKPYIEGEPLDGFTFAEIPHRNELRTGLTPGSNYNESGLSGEVCVKILPEVFIDDLYVFANPVDKTVAAEITVLNLGGSEKRAEIILNLFNPARDEIDEKREIFTAPCGKTIIKIELYADFVELWDIVNPALYEVCAKISSGGKTHSVIEKTGFRTFKVGSDGLFYLNGKKVFLKCTHTGNFIPRSCHNLLDEEGYLLKDLAKAKAVGFNAVRFIAGAATKAQLNLADELGLMVYEEPVSCWLQRNGNRTEELYSHDLLTLVKRDRNHPSIVIWGLLNETFLRPPYDVACKKAKNSLKDLRALDKTRLVMFSSGRWDAELSVGSVSNPFSCDWETLFNGEQKDGGFAEKSPARFTLNPDMGDLHFYPSPVPITDKEKELMLNFGGKFKRPVFISETGIGSVLDTATLVKKYSEQKKRDFYPDEILIKNIHNAFIRDLKIYGFSRQYTDAGEIFAAAYENHFKHRKLMFDLYRANPYINGLSLTGMLDHSVCGEGLYTLTREYKPKIADALENGFAPLRWSAILSKSRLYNTENLTIRGVLANEGVLKPQKYTAALFVCDGSQNTIYKKTKPFTPTEKDLSLFAINVFDESIPLENFKEGKYSVRISLLSGADDKAGVAEFYVDKFAPANKTVKTFGVSRGLTEKLETLGYELSLVVSPCGGKILVEQVQNDDINLLKECLAAGATVILIAADKNPNALDILPENLRPEARFDYDWLYHKELILKRGAYPFKGLLTGASDIDYYDGVFSETVFVPQKNAVPKTYAFAFSTGYPVAGGYIGGFQLAEYNVLNGKVLVNALNIADSLTARPAADKILKNLLK